MAVSLTLVSGTGFAFFQPPLARSANAQTSSVGESQVSSGAPPVVFCGQTLYKGAAGPAIDDFYQPGRFELTGGLQAGASPLPRVLDFVSSCQAGVSITFQPRRYLTIYSEARAADHKPVAIAVVAHRAGEVQVIVSRPQHKTTIIVVHVHPAEPYDHGSHVET